MAIKQLSIITSIYEKDSYEYLIADYLTKNIYNISKLSATDLIYTTGVSKTSFYRFLKYLGFSSFASLQQALLNDVKLFKQYHQMNIESYSFNDLLKGKKRVIVLGDVNFIAALLPYKQLYLNHGIELSIPLNGQSSYDNIKKYDLNHEDIVFYVSLSQSNYDLLIDLEGKYLKTIQYLKEKHIPGVYVGKTVKAMDYEKYYISVEGDTLAEMIYQLTIIFENMLGSF